MKWIWKKENKNLDVKWKFKLDKWKIETTHKSVNQNSTLMSAWDKINYGLTSLSSFEV